MLILRRKARAGIGDRDDRLTAGCRQRDVDPAAWRSELGGVVEQIRDDLAQSDRVALDIERFGRIAHD